MNGSTQRDLWYGTSGPQNADIVLVGESWGAEELNLKRPWVGTSGADLDRMLAEAGIDRNNLLMTNMVAEKPNGNETWRLFEPKMGSPQRIGGLAPSRLVVLEVIRLYNQIAAHPRKLVIAAGNWSLWALSRRTGTEVLRESNNRPIPPNLQTWAPNGIMNWRGSMWYCEPHPEFGKLPDNTKLLPIIHPAAIQRAWYNRTPTVHDLKTRVPLALRDDWRPNPRPITYAPPTYPQAINRLNLWITIANSGQLVRLAADVETVRKTFISVIGFADSVNFAMCIPFLHHDLTEGGFASYWTSWEEAELIRLIRKVLSHPNIRVIGQNFIYDTQFIQHWWGVTPALDHDTMLAQNVLFPGTPKALEYLSSLYCHYHWYWKEDHKDWSEVGDLQSLLDYNCLDNLRTWEIADRQVLYIKAVRQEAQVEFKMRTNGLCLRMMNRGILIDKDKRGSMLYEMQTALQGFYTELLQIVPQNLVKVLKQNRDGSVKKGEVYWYRSAKQTKELFYDILGFKVVRNRKTGKPTTGKEALMQLEKWYPEFTGLFRRLDYAGSVDNTVGVIQSPLDPDNRMRCSYNPGGTETHRLSSSENAFGRGTNLQNLTKGEEDE